MVRTIVTVLGHLVTQNGHDVTAEAGVSGGGGGIGVSRIRDACRA